MTIRVWGKVFEAIDPPTRLMRFPAETVHRSRGGHTLADIHFILRDEREPAVGVNGVFT